VDPEARVVASIGFFDFDHVGAEVGHDHAAGSGECLAEFDDLYAMQRPGMSGGQVQPARNESSRRLNSWPFRSSAAGVHK